MAQINLKNIKKIEKNRNTIHDKVYTTYTVFNADGDRYVQIDTYGKIDRENPEKTNLKKSVIEMFERTGRKCMYIG